MKTVLRMIDCGLLVGLDILFLYDIGGIMLYLIGFLVCFFSLAFFTLCILPGLSLALWKKIVLVLFFLICYLGYRAFVHWYARYVPADTIISTAKLTIMVIFPVGLVLKEHLQR